MWAQLMLSLCMQALAFLTMPFIISGAANLHPDHYGMREKKVSGHIYAYIKAIEDHLNLNA